MEILKEHEEYLDKVALETMKMIYSKLPPTSQNQSAEISGMAYQQALAMLDAKLAIEQLLNKTNFLYKQRRDEKKRKNELRQLETDDSGGED